MLSKYKLFTFIVYMIAIFKNIIVTLPHRHDTISNINMYYVLQIYLIY